MAIRDTGRTDEGKALKENKGMQTTKGMEHPKRAGPINFQLISHCKKIECIPCLLKVMGIYQRMSLHRIRKAQIRPVDICYSLFQNVVKWLQQVFAASIDNDVHLTLPLTRYDFGFVLSAVNFCSL